MSVNGRGAIAPQLTSGQLESLRECWDVHESPFARIGSEVAGLE